MQAQEPEKAQVVIPEEGDKYEHPTGTYEVDWVCDWGSPQDECVVIGLRGESLTWTGTVRELAKQFKRIE